MFGFRTPSFRHCSNGTIVAGAVARNVLHLQLMVKICEDQPSFAPFMPNDVLAEMASQLEEILSELNQVSDPTLRLKMLASTRLLMTEADRLAGPTGNDVQFS